MFTSTIIYRFTCFPQHLIEFFLVKRVLLGSLLPLSTSIVFARMQMRTRGNRWVGVLHVTEMSTETPVTYPPLCWGTRSMVTIIANNPLAVCSLQDLVSQLWALGFLFFENAILPAHPSSTAPGKGLEGCNSAIVADVPLVRSHVCPSTALCLQQERTGDAASVCEQS